MGDVAMTVPVIRQFVRQYPTVKITVLTRAFFTPFFREIDNVSVYAIDVKGKHKGVFGIYKLSREMRRLNIDAVADVHNVLRSNILKRFFLGKTFVQIDKGRAEKKALVTGKAFEQLKTTHQRYADVFENLGYPLNLVEPIFPERMGLSDKIQDILGKKPKPYIGIAPFAAFKSKAYPLELMEKVIEALSKSKIILLFGGGQNEVEALNKIEAKFHNTVNLAGKLSLNEELDVISNLSVMISMDSGNAHIAAMQGVEVITLWGVTHPYAGFYPFNQNTKNALLANREQFPLIPTSIYGNKFPEGYKEAISSISPESVVAKVESIIQKIITKKKQCRFSFKRLIDIDNPKKG
jgi:ADP-heptose:LPS heptosyltransferase